tara:strand:- start:562 stop:912 length:351 start_codon:yes stop_codon:yes gene_type:complete
MDKLVLEGIEARTIIGIHEEEKLAEQGILVSIVLHSQFESVIESDKLDDGIDYVDVVEAIRAFCKQHRGNTLEFLAHSLALHLKDAFSAERIELTIEKPRYAGKLAMDAIRFHVER